MSEYGAATWALGYDHAGYRLAWQLSDYFTPLGHQFEHFGPSSEAERSNYAPFCIAAAERVSSGGCQFGIVIGASAQGEQIAANKVVGIRAALCVDPRFALLARRDNDANVLALPGRIVAIEYAIEIVTTWAATQFEGGRHAIRLRTISDYERSTRSLDS